MRVIFAHHLTDDPGALTRSPVRLQPHLLHRKKYAAVHGLESVTYVGQRAADDHRHRVVEIRTAHLVFDVDRLNIQRTGAVAAGRWRSQWEFRILIVSHGIAFSFWLLAFSFSV